MAATNFNTENRTYRQLLGNGLTYRIPRFQRDYSWTEEEWEDLWLDILGTLESQGEPAHYMGYLVLQTTDNRTFDVIDGQQRLTTLSLIVLAGMKLLKRLCEEGENPEQNTARLDQLRASYIGYLDPVTLSSQPKLTLNRNNDDYYREYLTALSDHLPKRGFSASVHLMRKAFEWLERRLAEVVRDSENPGMAIARFVESMSDRLFFTVITVSDELNAYKVFETLNARGVRLSATDLLKNYLFSVLAREGGNASDLDDMERKWERMVDRLGSESFPDFLRMHWNSRHKFSRKSELFKMIRVGVRSRAEVFQLLREMDEDIDAYLALTQPEASDWSSKWREYAQELRMFSVRQPYPMLMAAKRKLDDASFERLLHAIVVIAFRYNVIGSLPPFEQERTFHSVAKQISDGHLREVGAIIDALRSVYPADEAFVAAFATKSIKTTSSRNAKVVRYILCRLERVMSGQEIDFTGASLSLEHVLPQNPSKGWDAFSDRDLESFVYRLGNMVLLDDGSNRGLENKSYVEKREAYLESGYSLTRELAKTSAAWSPERLEAWQKSLATRANTIWRIQRLSS